MTDFLKRLSEIPKEKLALIAAQLQPMSFAQQRLWFLDQLEPGSPFYNVPTAVRLSGRLDHHALERTLSEVVRRHEVLRTTFATIAGFPRQVVHAATPLMLPIVDLSELEEVQRETTVRRLAVEEARRGFDLSRGPLLRALLLRVGEQEHVALLTMHHIVSDGWSMGLLIREVSLIYERYSRGEEAGLAELAVQYGDYARWQREWLTDEALEEQVAYWKRQLAGAAQLELPTDHVRPAVQSYRGAHRSFSLAEGLAAGLRRVSEESSATLFMTLLGGFAVLLSRYSGQTDIVVGTDTAGRSRAEVENLIGYFINMLALRVEVRREESFRELLERVREVCLGGYAHQDVPFERVVEELQPERMLDRAPLVQVKLILQNTPMPQRLKLSGLELSGMSSETATTKLDLSVAVTEAEGELKVLVEYGTDLFEESRIERMVRHYEHLLTAAVQNPDERVSRLQMLGEAERRQLLYEFNQTTTDYPSSASIHELFSQQARQTPDAPALLFAGHTLSYRELDERSNQLAHYLQDCGVGAESLVGVLLPRSLEMVVSLLAVLKAGGAYVPLDSAYPLERLSLMMEDAGLAVLLTKGGMERESPGFWGRTVLLDEQWDEISRHSTDELETKVEPENAAYVIYTSGSTGAPKGVMVSHRSVVNYLSWAVAHYEVGQRGGAGAPLPSSLSFDLSVTSLYCPLLSGGRVHLLAEGAEIEELAAGWSGSQDYSLVKVTPGHLRLLSAQVRMEEGGGGASSGSRALVVGGESLSAQDALSWKREAEAGAEAGAGGGGRGGVRVYNEYGPTETAVGSSVYEVEGGEEGELPIGKPVANTSIYILDEEGQAVPVGVSGEIHIAGAGLARGYLHRPALTAEKFIPHPFSTRGGERMYRTGDIGRYRADGTIEYIGRADEQVKVRGYRIELGEIEHALRQHGQVRDCVVVAQGDGQEKRLVAYLVAEAGEELQVEAVRNYLKEKLPEYMIPAVMMVLDEIPLSPNGKVNRKALPSVEARNTSPTQNFQAARTPTEEILLSIWQDVLKVSPIGIHDNFFELGGHSLLATQVFSRLREVFGVELPLRTLFESPRVSDLALHLDAARQSAAGGSASLSLQPITARVKGESEGESESEPLPLSFAQQRLWFLDQLEPGSPFYNVPTAVRLSGRLDHRALERTLSEVVRRHEVLRTTFATRSGSPHQVVHAATPLILPIVDLSELEEADREATVRRLAVEEARRGFDLSRGPLLRAQVLRVSEREHVALLTMHHIVSDGWSMGLLIREVSLIYDRYSRGEEAGLAELAVQYGDYARWQREWLTDEVLEEQIAYWKRQLDGAAQLKLPTDRIRPAVQSYRGAHQSFEMESGLAAQLRRVSEESSATLFMTLLGGFAVLLSRYSGQTDIVVGTAIAGRNRAEIENLIGYFINMLALRVEVRGGESFRELLERVREVCLGGYAHQDVPFERVVEELQPERMLDRAPLVQVAFGMQNAPTGVLRMPELELSGVEYETEMVKYDLTLWMSEAGGELKGNWSYRTDLYDVETIRRMHRQYERLLQSIVERPDAPLSELDYLAHLEEEQRNNKRRNREVSNVMKLRATKRRAIGISQETPVNT